MIGKLGTSVTKLDMKTSFGKINTYNDGNKIEARDSFVSVRANNCVVKGKWCYEVLLESNGLFQIGFCQLTTPFNGQYGVGDDINSYGYDGYRLSCWNQKENRYGKVWDYGDIIGVCLDLDDKKIEYYQNGEKLGIVNVKIEKKPGMAYFPGLSFSDYEKCYFNFGACPFVYGYPGYEPMDIPKSQYNGSFEVTSVLLQCLIHSNLLDFLDNDFIDSYLRNLVNQKIFYFLITISFNDLFLCKCLLFPFMYSLMKKNKIQYQIFLEQLLKNINLNDNTTFFNGFYEKLTNIMEEYSLMGPKFYAQYQLFAELFITIISSESFFNKWTITKNFFGHLRNIFTSNSFHFSAVYNKIDEFYGDDKLTKTMSILFNKVVKEGNLITPEMNENDGRYINMNKIIIEKIFNYYERVSSLSHGIFIFYDLMRACYPINTIKDYIYDLNTFASTDNKKNILAFKNIILSYMAFFFDNYNKINLDELPIGSATIVQIPTIKAAIKNELSKTGIYVSYFKEENIGGKSSGLINANVHGNYFSSEMIFNGTSKRSSICFNLLIKLISLLDKFFFAYYEFQSLTKDYIFANYLPWERGTTLVNALFRYYFYLFNDQCQIILYKISFFLIKWLNNSILNKNIYTVLLLPLYLIDFPFQIAQLMLITKSKILFDDEYRKEINNKYDFLQSLCSLYITLFQDLNLSTYISLNQSLGWKIYLFLREQKTRNIIIKNEEYIKNIFTGILYISTNNNYERIILRILTVMKRTIFENIIDYTEEDINEEEKNIKNVKNVIENNNFKTSFNNLVHNFGKNVNSKLTTYCTNLNNCKLYCIDPNFNGVNITMYNNTLKKSLKEVISAINFYEFILYVSPDTFLDNKTLNTSLICIRDFFMTLTTSILDQTHFGYLEQILNYMNLKDSYLIDLINSIVNLILIAKNEEKKVLTDFIVTTRNLLLKPFFNIYDIGINIINEKNKDENKTPYYKIIIKRLEEYKKLLEELEEKKKVYDEEYLKNIKDIEYLDDEFLCIICFRQIADYRIEPCKHGGCKECLLKYMANNDKCFMCRQAYKSIEKVPDEEIKKLISNAKETKKGDEEQENNNNEEKENNNNEEQENNNNNNKEQENNNSEDTNKNIDSNN